MNESDAASNSAAPGTIERRTVLKMAAWATPAITLMSATPAFAATPGPTTGEKVSVTSATASRDHKTLTFVLTVTNPNTIAVTISTVTFPSPDGKWVSFALGSISPSPLPAGSTSNTITFTGTKGSANDAFDSFVITLIDLRTGLNRMVTLSGSAGAVSVVQS